MKRKISVVGLTLILLLTLVSNVSAALPGGGWWVFYQVQNVGSTAGTLAMQAYRTGDSTAYSGSFTIGAGQALAFHPGLAPTYPSGDRIGFTPELPSGFAGAVVLSADVPIVAVAQVGNNQSGSVGVSNGTATAFYQGIGGEFAATTINFPTVKHNFSGQTTTFYVQAAGADANATITYRMNDGSVHTQNTNITANHMFVFDPANATPPVASTNCGAAATSPCLGAATVQSTSGPIAGVVVEHPHTGSPAAFVLSTRGFTPQDADTTIFAPTIKNDFNGGTTGWSVQNTGGVATTVYVTFTVTNKQPGVPVNIGDRFYAQEVVGPGQAVVFSVYRNNLGGMPAGVYASGVASAAQPLVGSVNESKAQPNTPGGYAKAVYSCFGQSLATDKVALPMVKEMFSGNTTGVAVVNAGTGPTRFIATYTDANGVARRFQTVRTDIQPGEAVSFFQVFQNSGGQFQILSGMSAFSELQGTKNSVVITSSNGQPIVALAQESDRAQQRMDIKNYEGFNQ